MPFGTQTTQPAEDIGAVLGRFQAWTGKPVKPGAGAREISYEEAVKSSRYRRTESAPLPSAATKIISDAKGKPASASAAKAKGQAAVKTAPLEKPEEKAAKSARRAKRVSAPEKKMARTVAAAQPQFRQVLESSVAAQAKSSPMPTVQPVVPAQIRAVEAARPVMLSVRISGAEQAIIRARAQEANVSISAYMRQCALEVEQLREQVERTLTAMQRGISEQSSSPAPGFFGRIARKFLGIGPRSALAVRA